MITILSPAKTLEFGSAPLARDDTGRSLTPTIPQFLDDAHELSRAVKTLGHASVRNLFKISEEIAAEVVDSYARWSGATEHDEEKTAARAALRVFRGEAYRALDAATLTGKEIKYAQRNLRILSGLYGLLRPLDLIERYRLDFATPLAGAWGPSVYHYWKENLAPYLCEEARRVALADAPGSTPAIVNLASAEYARVLRAPGCRTGRLGTTTGGSTPCRVITVTFKEESAGALRTVGVYAKRARGLMARWIITRRIETPGSLTRFNEERYRFRADLSNENESVFTRSAG